MRTLISPYPLVDARRLLAGTPLPAPLLVRSFFSQRRGDRRLSVACSLHRLEVPGIRTRRLRCRRQVHACRVVEHRGPTPSPYWSPQAGHHLPQSDPVVRTQALAMYSRPPAPGTRSPAPHSHSRFWLNAAAKSEQRRCTQQHQLEGDYQPGERGGPNLQAPGGAAAPLAHPYNIAKVRTSRCWPFLVSFGTPQVAPNEFFGVRCIGTRAALSARSRAVTTARKSPFVLMPLSWGREIETRISVWLLEEDRENQRN